MFSFTGYNVCDTSFTAHWQYKQYSNLKDNLPEGYLLMVIDFAKNRSVYYQDEIKEAFFGQLQITVHPIVMYYLNNQQQLVKDVMICVSEDRSHDVHAVKHFLDLADNYLSENGIQFTRKVIFSDGCASQYKSSRCFADLTLSKCSIDRNFYGSEHGRGESDGETGILNRMIDKAIVGRRVVIQNAEEMYNFCNENLVVGEDLNKRHFAYASKTDINRSRPFIEVKTLKGCRKIHQAQAVPPNPYNLTVRNLSCFCKHCKSGKLNQCINKDYVGLFVPKQLELQPCKVSLEGDDSPDLSLTGVFPDIDFTENVADWVPEDLNEAIDVLTSGICCTEEGDCVTRQTTSHVSTATGSYIGVQFDSKIYPAVVVCTPEGYDLPPAGAVYGYYFEPTAPSSNEERTLWRLEETPYLMMPDELQQSLTMPDIVPKGTRILYHFTF